MIARGNLHRQTFTIIPMVVTEVQEVIAAGQFRPTDQLETRSSWPVPVPDDLLEPLYEGQFPVFRPAVAASPMRIRATTKALHTPGISNDPLALPACHRRRRTGARGYPPAAGPAPARPDAGLDGH